MLFAVVDGIVVFEESQSEDPDVPVLNKRHLGDPLVASFVVLLVEALGWHPVALSIHGEVELGQLL